MHPKQPVLIVALVALLGGAVWLFAMVLGMRFEGGTVYPAYSTLRADPLGAKALYEALDRLPEVEAKRNFMRLGRLKGKRGETLMLLDVPPSMWVDGQVLEGKDLERYAAAGARVVITLDGEGIGSAKVMEEARQRRLEREKQRLRKMKKKKDGEEISDEELKAEGIELPKSVGEILGLDVKAGKFVMTGKGGYELTRKAKLLTEEVELPLWHSKTTIQEGYADEGKWEVLAELDGDAVMMERQVGMGSILVCTDSYFVSNEALWKKPSSGFLMWMIGDAKSVLFDETHLGTQQTPGIMELAHRFRLQGFFVGGVILFCLFIWQASSSLVPSQEKVREAGVVSGQGAIAGLICLLRRGIRRKQLLGRSLDAYEKGLVARPEALQRRIDDARALVVRQEGVKLSRGSLVNAYAEMIKILKPRMKR